MHLNIMVIGVVNSFPTNLQEDRLDPWYQCGPCLHLVHHYQILPEALEVHWLLVGLILQ